MNKSDYIVTLFGYTTPESNSCYWPWAVFKDVFDTLGYENEWINFNQLQLNSKRRIYICWNVPDAEDLNKHGYIRPGDIVLQKLTSIGSKEPSVNWGNDPYSFYKTYNWGPYQRFEKLHDRGINVYAFGCKTAYEDFPEKKRICEKLKDKIYWIPWGSSLYHLNDIKNAAPVMDNFEYDIGYVGMKWGQVGRGNVDAIAQFLDPIVKDRKCALAGNGNPLGMVDNEKHKQILKASKLCPIINAPSWRAEKAIQDRFWSVFTTGRFGVADTEGVLDFFNEDEVVFSTDPGEYVELSEYYLKNVDKQLPFIEKIQKRIKAEYNYYKSWENILESIIKEQ